MTCDNVEVVFDLETFLYGERSGAGEPAASLGHHGRSQATVLCNAGLLASLIVHEHRGA